MDAKEFSKRIIKEYNDLIDYINDCTDKRIPITEEINDHRKDLSRLWLALAGNPHSTNGSFKHGQPRIYELMESYHQAKSMEENLNKHSDRISLLVDYTNWLLGEGYVDSDVYSEEPSAIDLFLAAFGKEEG